MNKLRLWSAVVQLQDHMTLNVPRLTLTHDTCVMHTYVQIFLCYMWDVLLLPHCNIEEA